MQRFAYYDDAGFNPEFDLPPPLPENKRHLEPDMQSICGTDSVACQYDYVVTGDREFAKVTKIHEAWSNLAFSSSKEEIIRCPALQKPMNGRKSENRYELLNN